MAEPPRLRLRTASEPDTSSRFSHKSRTTRSPSEAAINVGRKKRLANSAEAISSMEMGPEEKQLEEGTMAVSNFFRVLERSPKIPHARELDWSKSKSTAIDEIWILHICWNASVWQRKRSALIDGLLQLSVRGARVQLCGFTYEQSPDRWRPYLGRLTSLHFNAMRLV